jgi:hypothetical protein
MMASAVTLGIRWVLYAAGPWVLLILAISTWFMTMYVLAPILLPFSAYTFSGGAWTIFSDKQWAMPINIAYSAVLASIATWLGRRLSFLKSLGLFFLLVTLIALAVHGLMALLGYDYWYDSP